MCAKIAILLVLTLTDAFFIILSVYFKPLLLVMIFWSMCDFPKLIDPSQLIVDFLPREARKIRA